MNIKKIVNFLKWTVIVFVCIPILIYLASATGILKNHSLYSVVESKKPVDNTKPTETVPTEFIQIAVDAEGLPFMLDDAGHVWAFYETTYGEPISCKPFQHIPTKKPVRNLIPHGPKCEGTKRLIQIQGLENIKKIVPYEALDDKGQVFVWGLLNVTIDDTNSISQTSYTSATKLSSLSSVTDIAHSFGHGFAVIDGNRIVTWEEITRDANGKWGYEITNYGPIQEIYSGTRIKSLAAAAGDHETEPISLIALLEDGTVFGWGITEFGQASRKNTGRVELGKFLGALDIDLNGMHTAVVTEDGVPLFWGGCDLDGFSIRGYKPWIWGHLNKVALALQDVQAVSLAKDTGHGGDDNVSYDVFMKRDGTVWGSRPPTPSDAPDSECGIYGSDVPPT